MSADRQRNPGSFRDPDGFVFSHDGNIYRHLAPGAREDYTHLMESGLHGELAGAGLLVSHEEVQEPEAFSPGSWKVIRPRPVPFLSWPYEWSFSQLRAAALLTLRIARRALDKGMMLKDASAYNVQFSGARPLFIDTLSFTRWNDGSPWPGYRQFCEHFLAPLALAALRDRRLLRLQRNHLDGIPLDLASRLLPLRSRMRPGLLAHLHAHAAFQKKHGGRPTAGSSARASLSRRGFEGILDNLEGTVKRLAPKEDASHWAAYYDETNYSDAAFDEKKRLVRAWLSEVEPRTVWDLGANTGTFSAIAAEREECTVVAFEADEVAADRHFQKRAEEGHERILPLVMDLANPSPNLGWDEAERPGFKQRAPAQCLLALALVHHLAIGNNLPLPHLACALAGWGKHLIVEFVPKEDSQVQRLLASREDIFPDYHEEGFRAAFSESFEVLRSTRIGESVRTLYLMKARGAKP